MNNSQLQQKFIYFIPVPVALFVTVIFYLLGGGGTEQVPDDSEAHPGQLSTAVPTGSEDEDTFLDKITAYTKSDEAKQSFLNKAKKDNHLQWLLSKDSLHQEEDPYGGRGYAQRPNELAFKTKEAVEELDEQQDQLDKQLEQLEKQLKTKQSPRAPTAARRAAPSPTSSADSDAELARKLAEYERAKALAEPDDTNSILGDDFNQMTQMLQTITDIQHPEQVAERRRQQSLEKRGEWYSVASLETEVPISYLGDNEQAIYQERFRQYIKDKADSSYRNVSEQSISGFMGLGATRSLVEENTVPAVVHGTQEVTAGSTVKLRLQSPIVVAGHRVETGSFIFGTADFQASRLQVNITSVLVDETVVPVAMDVYDQDGMEGIFIPDIAAKVVAQQTAAQATSSLRLNMANPNLAGRAVDEGLRGIRDLVRVKSGQTKATIKNNYEIVLLNQKKI